MRVVELTPENVAAWNNLGTAYYSREQYDSAGEAYSRAGQLAESTLEINSQDWRTQGMLATYYLHVGRESEAQAAIESSLANSERDPEMLLYAALVRVVLGEEKAALDAIEEMLELDATFRLYVAEDPDLQKLNGNPLFDQMMK
jgi:tetratricopeptide (TPR) repeat protein